MINQPKSPPRKPPPLRAPPELEQEPCGHPIPPQS